VTQYVAYNLTERALEMICHEARRALLQSKHNAVITATKSFVSKYKEYLTTSRLIQPKCDAISGVSSEVEGLKHREQLVDQARLKTEARYTAWRYPKRPVVGPKMKRKTFFFMKRKKRSDQRSLVDDQPGIVNHATLFEEAGESSSGHGTCT
jgi:hypothetical protein